MSNSSDFQDYNNESLQWVTHQDGLTYVMTPTGETIAAVSWLQIADAKHDRMGLGESANKAICSKCYDEGRHVVWDPKPASLGTFIITSRSSFGCIFCEQQFLTKEQAIVHAMGHHMTTKDRKVAATYVLEL
ncbi:hypothetical protein RhiXN_03678 [Rhizoctonia solani]|uniref:C2H2-type domain-containing protein n=1 Tax=Rhizoctonia solani TaxID=456999 RepID=A0A8H8NNZ2_9AGAM|nr:uncharacterized protein RhiXN_03678 [Rhizoctonia solani]QRW15677.1 hypothetical protein RhiXN_03678 [Rhizoctonia solani]